MRFSIEFSGRGGAVKRTIKRAVGAVRSFAAALTPRWLQGWKWDGGYSNKEIKSGLVTTRSRSRDMYKNSAHYRRFVHLCQTNIVGEGFVFKAMPHDGIPGGPNFKLDRRAASFIEYHYKRWADNPNWCDTSGTQNIVEIDKMNVKSWKRDGEYFMLIDRNAQNPYGISLQVIRPDSVDSEYNVTLTNKNVVIMGVEFDNNTGRPIAVYVGTSVNYAEIWNRGKPLKRYAKEDFIHGFTREEAGQARGITDGVAILRKLKMLDDFDEAELVIAKDEACTVRSYYAPANRETEVLALTDEDAGLLTQAKEPGLAEVLPNGWDSKVQTPQHPNREVTAFKNSMLRDIASGVQLEYANFANDWAGVSFSSVRQGTQSERDTWMSEQGVYIQQCKSPVYLAWLTSFLSLSVSGGFPIAKFAKFAEHSFKGRRWGYINPVQDVKASAVAVEHGWKTDSQIASEYGNDFDRNVEEIKRTDEIKKGSSLEVKEDEKQTA